MILFLVSFALAYFIAHLIASFVTVVNNAIGWTDDDEIETDAIFYYPYRWILSKLAGRHLADEYELMQYVATKPLLKPIFVCKKCTAFWLGCVLVLFLCLFGFILNNIVYLPLYFIPFTAFKLSK